MWLNEYVLAAIIAIDLYCPLFVVVPNTSNPFSLVELSIQFSWMELFVIGSNVKLPGALGWVCDVLALPPVGREEPPPLKALIWKKYSVFSLSPLRTNCLTSATVVPTELYSPAREDDSNITKPSSLSELSDQFNWIELVVKGPNGNILGAFGGFIRVAALATLL